MLKDTLFRVGDTVTVAQGLNEEGEYYMLNDLDDWYSFVPLMYEYRNRTLRINQAESMGYHVEQAAGEHHWGFVDDMFVESLRISRFLTMPLDI